MNLRTSPRAIAFVVLTAVLFAGSAAPAAAQGFTNDTWAPQAPAASVNLKVNFPVDGLKDYAPVHATLLPNGRIMLFGKAGLPVKAASFAPTPFDQDPPAQVVLDIENVPVDINQMSVVDKKTELTWLIDETLFCSGHSLMDDGSLFVAGGTLLFTHLDDDTGVRTNVIYGMPNATLYSYPTQTWSRVPGNMPEVDAGGSNMALRWYGAVTRLADSRMLLTSGWDYVETATIVNGQTTDIHVGTQNRSVETWTAAAGYTSVSTHAHTPAQVWNHDYTHVFQLPYDFGTELVLMFGEASVPVFFAPDMPAASQWTPVTNVQRPGTASAQPDHGVSAALLPLRVANGEWGYANGSVLEAGGEAGSAPERHVDLYEFSSNHWFNIIPDMGGPRRYPTNVLLPDGKVLVVNGYDSQGSATPVVQNAQYLDVRPPTSFKTGAAVMGEVRGYHNVAILLPDGRVFVAGGRTGSETSTEDEKANFRYLYPPYMSPRDTPPPRPAITSVPALVHYGQNFSVGFSGGPISEAVLMGLGSMTHSFDTNQRYVQLAMTSPGASPAQVTAPPNRQTAPAGYYMLFVLDQNHVPSVASIVQLLP